MAVVERTFVIDEELAVALDKIYGLDKQSEYVNRLFASLIEQKTVKSLKISFGILMTARPNKAKKQARSF